MKRKSFFWRRVSFLFGFSVICMLIVSVSYFAGEHISSASGGDKPVGAKGKITVILTTHYMEEAEALSDRIGIMKDGKLLVCGTAEEIKSSAETDKFEEAFIRIVRGTAK